MCTVTYIPSGEKKFLTSNRDEKTFRKKALPPQIYLHEGVRLIYPKDGDAGGSWIAVNENNNAAVLLNGGFEKHVSKPPYKKSRGLVFLEIIKRASPSQYFFVIDLSNIEPFTIVILEDNKLFECRWSTDEKSFKELDTLQPHIWSSATLYEQSVRIQREQWFGEWLMKNQHPQQNDIVNFHQFAGEGNKHTDLIMKRGKIYRTVSITSLELGNKANKICYYDLTTDDIFYLQTKVAVNSIENNSSV